MPIARNGNASYADQSNRSIDRYNADTERLKALCEMARVGDALARSDDEKTAAVGRHMIVRSVGRIYDLIPVVDEE